MPLPSRRAHPERERRSARGRGLADDAREVGVLSDAMRCTIASAPQPCTGGCKGVSRGLGNRGVDERVFGEEVGGGMKSQWAQLEAFATDCSRVVWRGEIITDGDATFRFKDPWIRHGCFGTAPPSRLPAADGAFLPRKLSLGGGHHALRAPGTCSDWRCQCDVMGHMVP